VLRTGLRHEAFKDLGFESLMQLQTSILTRY
jgi:hypothetical protein